MFKKHNCDLFKRATRPVYIWTYQYGWMPSGHTRVTSHLQLNVTSPSPAIQDFSGSGNTRHLPLWSYKTSPSPTVEDISATGRTRHLRLRLRPVYAICRREMRWDGANHHEKLGHKEFRVWVNLLSLTWQIQVPIRCVITTIRGLPN